MAALSINTSALPDAGRWATEDTSTRPVLRIASHIDEVCRMRGTTGKLGGVWAESFCSKVSLCRCRLRDGYSGRPCGADVHPPGAPDWEARRICMRPGGRYGRRHRVTDVRRGWRQRPGSAGCKRMRSRKTCVLSCTTTLIRTGNCNSAPAAI